MKGFTSALALLVCIGLTLHAVPARATSIRYASLASDGGAAALTIELNHTTSYKLFTLGKPARVVLDLGGSRFAEGVHLPRAAGLVEKLRAGPRPHGGLRIVLQLDSSATPHGRAQIPVHARWRRGGCGAGASDRRGATCLVVKVGEEDAPHIARVAPDEQTTHTATVTRANFTPSSSEAVLRPIPAPHAPVLTDRDVVIAVDAGHGGKDPGAIGRDGTEEKNVTLAIARALAARIDAEPGMRAVLTRDSDVFLLLKDRRDRAREAHADLFVSVHADSIHDPTVSGASVYVLSERGATDEAANWLAERENAADRIGGVPLDDKNNTLKSVLIDLSQNESISASMTAAEGVIAALNRVGEVRKPRVQQAGFVVLKSRDIPAMLVETAYISNPGDERRLRSSRVQHKLADAIFKGLRGYFEEHPPAGTRFARLVKEGSGEEVVRAAATPHEPETAGAPSASTGNGELAARP